MKTIVSVFLYVIICSIQIYAVSAEEINLNAKAAVIMDAESGKILYEKSKDQKMPNASTTKILTCLYILKHCDLDQMAEVSKNAAMQPKVRLGVREGEKYKVKDLLYGLMLESYNDCAVVLAEHAEGSVEKFEKRMNQMAENLGTLNTHFVTPNGLDGIDKKGRHETTAQDLAKIAAACAENQTFAQVAGTASYVLPATNLRKAEYTISSSNSLMNSESANYREYVKWVKGGFTTLAGRCIVAFAQQDGHNYGLVILGCDTPDHLFTACDDLFDWAFASFADRPLVDTKTVLTTVDLNKCRTEPAVELYAAAPVSGYGHSDDKVSYSFDLPESVSATVKEGQKLGTATVYLDGYEVGQVDLVTHREYVSDFRTDIKATLLLLCALILILCALGFVTLRCGGGMTLNQRRRQMKKRR